MFLFKLSEDEKQAFMNLANWVSEADGKIGVEENELLQEFAKEMGLLDTNYKKEKSIDDCFKVFETSSNVVKRTVYIELLSLVISDNEVDNNEKETLNIIQNNLGLPDEFTTESYEWLISYSKLTEKGFRLIEGAK